MEITARDKKLLVYLLAIAIAAAAYMLGAKPLLDKQLVLNEEVASLEQQLRHCNDIYENREAYETKTAQAQTEYNLLLAKFSKGLEQENTLMMLKDIENATNVWISRVSFQPAELLTASTGEEGEAAQVTAEEAAAVIDVEPADGDNSTVSIENLIGLKQTLILDYACNYDDFKRFIEYVNNYDKRLYISSINASYVADSNQITGSLTLSHYAINGLPQGEEAPDLSNVTTGVDNVFSTLTGTGYADSAEGGDITLNGESADGENGENAENAESGDNADASEGSSESEDRSGSKQSASGDNTPAPAEEAPKPAGGIA